MGDVLAAAREIEVPVRTARDVEGAKRPDGSSY